MRQYGPKIRARAKQLYVQEGKSPREIVGVLEEENFQEVPSWQTVDNWRRKKDRTDKTWMDYREDEKARQYEMVSEENLARKILQKIYDRLGNDNDKMPDDMAKLAATMRKIVDPKFQIHIMYSMLTDQVKYAKKYFPDLANERYLEMVRDFKNFLRGRLDD